METFVPTISVQVVVTVPIPTTLPTVTTACFVTERTLVQGEIVPMQAIHVCQTAVMSQVINVVTARWPQTVSMETFVPTMSVLVVVTAPIPTTLPAVTTACFVTE